jgi:hypothetical protein
MGSAEFALNIAIWSNAQPLAQICKNYLAIFLLIADLVFAREMFDFARSVFGFAAN